MIATLGRVALALFLLAGAATAVPLQAQTTAPGPLPAHGLRLPATFTGRLPCPDCAGIEVRLDLWPDQVFELQRTWLGKDQKRSEAGRWRIDAAHDQLVLHGSAEMPQRFEIKAPDRLRALDPAGDLSSRGALMPAVDLSLLIAGDFVPAGESGRLTDCLTGRTFAVARAGDLVGLLGAYRATQPAAGTPLHVTVEATLRAAPAAATGDAARSLTVDRFVNAWPRQACERARAPAALENTYWRIVRLGDTALSAATSGGRREPHLVLRAVDGERRFAATVGCNQMIGGYTVSGGDISFGSGAGTLMACPDGLAAQEKALQAVLAGARRWRIAGNTLEISDAMGRPLGLFEAVYF